MSRSNLQLAAASIRGAKLRTFLTIIAVIIGVWSYTVVTTTVDGIKSAAAGEINQYGGNLVQVLPGKVIIENPDGSKELNFAASFGTSTITEKDYEDIKKLDQVEHIAPFSLIGAQVSRGDLVVEGASVIATTPDYPAAFAQKIDKGSFLSEETNNGHYAVVGQGVVDELYSGELALGTKITVRNQSFTVIGSMADYETAFSFGGAPNLNDAIFISLESAKELSSGFISIQEMDMQLKADANPNDTKAEIESILLKNHSGEEDFTVLTQEELIDLTDSLFGIIKQAGQFLAYVMLFVSSVVILLIMLITVRERTREIGIRKSIGATNMNIMTQFLVEAITISWLGGVIGVFLGYLTGFAVKRFVDITPVYSVNTLISLIAITTFVGAVAGFIPAWSAARKDPVESLRHD
jgi:putative ABC transport system permease protein